MSGYYASYLVRRGYNVFFLLIKRLEIVYCPKSISKSNGKPTVYDSEQPRNHTRKKTGGRGESVDGKKRTPGTHNFYFALFGVSERQKSARDTLAQTPRPGSILFQNPVRYGVPLLGLPKSIYISGGRFRLGEMRYGIRECCIWGYILIS